MLMNKKIEMSVLVVSTTVIIQISCTYLIISFQQRPCEVGEAGEDERL